MLKDNTTRDIFLIHIEVDDLVIGLHAYKSCDGIHIDEHIVSHRTPCHDAYYSLIHVFYT